MTPTEQARRFTYALPPVNDCHLAKKARKDARRQIAARFATIATGFAMGALLGASMLAGAVLGG